MKNMRKLFYIGWALVVLVTACTKVADLPFYKQGNSVVLSSNFTSVTSTLADSNRNVISFSWTNPQHGTYTVDASQVITYIPTPNILVKRSSINKHTSYSSYTTHIPHTNILVKIICILKHLFHCRNT